MFAVFYEEKLITVFMLISLLLSMFTRIMIGILYQNMIKETENMSATKHKILKQCKLKFANCYQLNSGVANIPIFVDKFMGRLKIGPFTFQTMYHLSGQLMLLSVFFAGVGVCKSIIAGFTIGAILPFYIVSFLGMYLYFAISAIADIKGRRRILKTNLVDYLENHMVSRLAQSDYTADEGEYAGRRRGREQAGGEQRSDREQSGRELGSDREQAGREQKAGVELMPVHGRLRGQAGDDTAGEQAVERKGRIFTLSEEKELEELLKEFLTS